MSARLGIPIPEMIFGDNLVAIQHASSGWSIEFTAEAALDGVDKTGANMLQVAYAGEWSSSREKSSAHDIQQVVKPYDWSYSTVYKGTETAGGEQKLVEERKQIPLELLKRRDPILFFDEVVLFESELDDNGVSIYSVKVRVMEQRMLLLARLYMRLDNVVVRIRDTRVYVEFGTGEVIREYTVKEDSFANVKKVSQLILLPKTTQGGGWLELTIVLVGPHHDWFGHGSSHIGAEGCKPSRAAAPRDRPTNRRRHTLIMRRHHRGEGNMNKHLTYSSDT